MMFLSARWLFGARSIVGICALFSLLVLFERAAVADIITFTDNNDVVSFSYVGTDITGPGGSISSGCSSHVCTVTISPVNAFSGGPYMNFNIIEPNGTLGDTLSEGGPGLVLTFTSDTDPTPLTPMPSGAFGIPGILDGLPHLANTVLFGTPSGTLAIGVYVQQTNDNDVPEPSTGLLISLGFAGLLGSRILRRARKRALAAA